MSSLLTAGMQSRWGKMLEEMKRKGAKGEAKGVKRKAEPGGSKKVRTKVVACLGVGGVLVCPECQGNAKVLEVDTEEEFRLHVFHCRLEHGTDPLLPVVSLIPRPPRNEKPLWQVPPTTANRPSTLKIPVPPAAQRCISYPPIAVLPKAPRDATPSSEKTNKHLSNEANILAVKRLIAAKPPNSQSTANLTAILKAVQQETDIDLTDVSISPEDATALAVLLADHPSASLVELGKIAPEAGRFLGPLVVKALQKNKNLLHFNHGLGKNTCRSWYGIEIDDRLERSVNEHSVKAQQSYVTSLEKEYERWARARHEEVQYVSDGENETRAAILSEHAASKGKMRVAFKTELNALIRRRQRAEILLRKQGERVRVMDAETAKRKELAVFSIGSTLWLVVQEESIVRMYQHEYQLLCRREVKISEEDDLKAAKIKERSRLGRERQARLMVEEHELSRRDEIGDMQWFEWCQLGSLAEAGMSLIYYLEAQALMRKEMAITEQSQRCGVEKEEEVGRLFIYERRANYLALKEQERLRAREQVALEEVTARADIGEDFLMLMTILSEEMKYSLEWLNECVTLHNIEHERETLLNQPPAINLNSCIEYNSKPFIFFVHPFKGIEPPVQVTSSATITIILDTSWIDKYKAVVESRSTQRKIEREAQTNLLKTRAKNSKLLKALSSEIEKVAPGMPIDANQGAKNKKGKNVKVLQAAVKMGMRTAEGLPAYDIAEGKVVVKGGYILMQFEPSETDPEWLADSVMLSCATTWDVEVDGCQFDGESDAAEGDPDEDVWDAKPEYPKGKIIKVLIPDGATEPELTSVVRGCRFQTTGHGITAPIVIKIRFEINIKFSNCEGGVVTASSSLLCDVVLALPFISYGSVEPELVEYTEGMRPDELQLVPDSITLTDPPTITKRKGHDTFSVMSGGQQGGGLSLTNFHDSFIVMEIHKGYTPDDIVAFKNTAKLFIDDDKIHHKDKDGSSVIGTIVKGALVSCNDVYEGLICQPKFVLHLFHEANPGILAAENVRNLLKALRFTNTSQAPVEGGRQALLTVIDRNRFSSQIHIDIEVTGKDNPTEMTIHNLRLVIRQSQVPTMLKPHLSPNIYPSPEVSILQAVATDMFVGGSLQVILYNMSAKGTEIKDGPTKGEGVSLCTHEALLLNVIQKNQTKERDVEEPELIGRGRSISYQSLKAAAEEAGPGSAKGSTAGAPAATTEVMVVDRVVFFKGREVGVVTKGEVITADSPLEATDGANELLIEFTNDGMMSIEACQALLRRLALTTFSPKNGLRQVEINLTIGPTVNGEPEIEPETEIPEFSTELSCFLQEKISIRYASPLLTIPEKYAVTEYREGTGPQRLAPFDLVHDKPGFVESYGCGFIAVEIVEGNCEGEDSLALREDETIKLVDTRKRLLTKAKEQQQTQRSKLGNSDLLQSTMNSQLGSSLSSDSATPVSPVSPLNLSIGVKGFPGAARMSELRDKIRDAVKEEAKERRDRRESLIGAAQLEIKNLVKESAKARERELFADVVFAEKQIGTLRKSASGSLFISFKGESVGRRHALTVLRNLTYNNTSSDPQTLRKVIRVTISDNPPSSSQCLFELNVIPVDDVTEITLKHTKIKYISYGASPAPFYICPYGVSRLTDADTEFFDGGQISLSLAAGGLKGDQLSFVPVEPTAELVAHPPGTFCTGELQRVRLADDKKIYLQQPEEGDEEEEVHVGTLVASDADKNTLKIQFAKGPQEGRVVTLNVASLLLNCVAFSNPADTRKPGTRTYQIKVSDGDNPVEGKAKVQIDNGAPLCFYTPFSYQAEVKYDPEGTFFNDGAKQKLSLSSEKPDKPITSGCITFEALLSPEPSLPALHLPQGYTSKDGGLFKDQVYFGKLLVTPTLLRLTFTWASKGSLKAVQAFVRGVMFKLEEPMQDAEAGVQVTTCVAVEPHSTTCVAVIKP